MPPVIRLLNPKSIAMTRQQQLAFCKVCTNRKLTTTQGIVCGLTGEQATFLGHCEQYQEDPDRKLQEVTLSKQREFNHLTVDRGLRFANYLIDLLFLLALNFGFGMLLGIILMLTSPETLEGMDTENPLLDYLFSFIISLLYYTLIEGLTGRSIGKLITRTKVVMEDGSKLTFDAAVIRSLCRHIPFEAFSFLADDARGWHDTLSKTRVIKTE